jgi:hypothetical protein
LCTKIAEFCPAQATVGGDDAGSGCAAGMIGDACSNTCNPGHTANLGVICLASGEWSANPVCQLDGSLCSQINAPNNAVAGCSASALNAGCTIVCATGFANTLGTFTCTSSGDWTVSVSDLENTCEEISDYCPAVTFGATGCSVGTYGAACDNTCPLGKSPAPGTITCRADRSWSATPQCFLDMEHCAASLVPDNAVAGCSGGPLGGLCEVDCADGYLAPPSSCGSDGQWDPAPSCKLNSDYCPAIQSTDSDALTGCSAGSLGQACDNTCPDGFVASSGHVCEIDRTWSTVPTCTRFSIPCSIPSNLAKLGYQIVSPGSLFAASFQIEVDCTTGRVDPNIEPTATACLAEGGPFRVEGCLPDLNAGTQAVLAPLVALVAMLAHFWA